MRHVRQGIHWPGAAQQRVFPKRACALVAGPRSWQIFLRELGSVPEEWPAISWDKDVLLVCLAGQKPTGGYSLEIRRVVVTEDTVVVEVHEESPPPDAVVIMVLTSPYHVVRVPRAEFPAAGFTLEVALGEDRERTTVGPLSEDALYVVPLPTSQ